MTAATDALKRLRSLCSNRTLTLNVSREPVFVTVELIGRGWQFFARGTHAESVYLHAHAAVLAQFPPIKPKGGARSTRATRAAGRARKLAEQRAAMGVES